MTHTTAAVASLTEVYAEHMRFEDARETAETIVAGWSPERIAAYAGVPAAEASGRCWERLAEELWAEGHRRGRDKTIPYAAAHARAVQARCEADDRVTALVSR